MISETAYFTALYIWMGLAVVTFPVLLKITVPYGRHTTNTWGPTISNKLGWFIMELPAVAIFSWFFFTGPVEKTIPLYIFYGTFTLHYLNRMIIFPLRMKGKRKHMPLAIVGLAIFFNIFNGFFNGYWFGYLTPGYDNSWLLEPKFIAGAVLLLTGMLINVSSDQKLLSLRKGEHTGYYIPYGGMFKYVSSPNLFGEILEWLGWAMMSWCLPSFSFALWTMANLLPRALDHRRWYRKRFPDCPKARKAVIPFIL
ncbi:MAG: 3-oxo-5-alpha-steroid 4-dehydrogenase [Bacteroidetes bacterium]|nr:MAG: 3-oxo-5-alpha-steroid 4-dehydrogenase [Bacteroidota bacterium]